ncbi:low temperature requirement protein A [Planococcus versutus]|uniref:Low temperature requirement protein A n=1 Tax=Planococcus versutus TaxID=1302659 RepID=A0A1B1S1E3_9BACL|nr:low temperature requirement protein A [Planococcus versutus]ANU27001.1 low temperature requirement protein A [Planococcus versutus]
MTHKPVLWLELFFDLIFVAAIAKATHVLLHLEDGVIPIEFLLKFVLIFIPIWWSWVGHTLYTNRFGEDRLSHRLFMILQMFFMVVLTASLSPDFDSYYMPFLIGYIGVRLVTSIQYLYTMREVHGEEYQVAKRLGYGFLIGITISLLSLFFDSWIRYFFLYLGIFVDILVPILSRKHLKKVPVNTPHLLERFGLLTIILFGESIVSLVAIFETEGFLWSEVSIIFLAFLLIIAMWWQYFDNLEKKIDKEIRTSGQIIIYGHLFILMSMSLFAAVIRMSYLYKVDPSFLLLLTFGTAFVYFLSTTVVFHKYRMPEHRLQVWHLLFFISILVVFLIFNLLIPVEEIVLLSELLVFFVIYTYVTTR